MDRNASYNQGIVFYLFLFMCIVFPVNFEIFQGIRILDILSIVFIFLQIRPTIKINKSILTLISVNIIILFLSEINGFLSDKVFNSFGIAFYYKYIMVIVIPLMIINLKLTKKQIIIIFNAIFISSILLSLWVFLYLWLTNEQLLTGNNRPSYPFSSDYSMTDSHLLSSYLSFFLVTYTLYLNKILKHGSMFSFVVSLLLISSIIMTGAKTGILIMILAAMYALFRAILTPFRINRKYFITGIFFLILIALLYYYFSSHPPSFSNNYSFLLERSFSFNLLNDASSLGRVAKLIEAFHEVYDNYYLIGNGMMVMNQDWYDGLISHLIARSGLMGFVFFMLLMSYILYYTRRNSTNMFHKHVFTLLFLLYLFINLITEYFLVFRGYFPTIVVLILIYKYGKISEITCEKSTTIHFQK